MPFLCVRVERNSNRDLTAWKILSIVLFKYGRSVAECDHKHAYATLSNQKELPKKHWILLTCTNSMKIGQSTARLTETMDVIASEKRFRLSGPSEMHLERWSHWRLAPNVVQSDLSEFRIITTKIIPGYDASRVKRPGSLLNNSTSDNWAFKPSKLFSENLCYAKGYLKMISDAKEDSATERKSLCMIFQES